MPRKKAVPENALSVLDEPRSLRKRSREVASPVETTPSKRRRASVALEANIDIQITDTEAEESIVAVTNGEAYLNGEISRAGEEPGPHPETQHQSEPEPPKTTPRRRGRPPKARPNGDTPTKPNLTPIFETPTKPTGLSALTPGRAADRSARRKSARALIDQVVGDGASDDEQVDDTLVREIYESSDADDGDEGDDELEDRTDGEGVKSGLDEVTTPSKTPRRKGRPRKAKSPTPPRDLPPHEQYFAHNKPGRPKTSDNTLASLSLLTHDEYFSILHEYQDRHAKDIEYLESLHAESFPQWVFELSQGFSICLFGLGSKRQLLRSFATHIHKRNQATNTGKIVMVNGYAHTTTLREILSVIGSAIDPSHRIPNAQPTTMVQNIASHLSATSLTLTVVINSIDANPLRKPGTQAILAQLASHPQINLICSADTPDFSLLWDIGVRSAFNFVFHDCTTFSPFKVELDVVDDVHELLGRQAQRVNGREGVAFVLKSLTENAKLLFRLLVGETLIAMEEDGSVVNDGVGLEYRMVYNKSVEEFICTSEMAFRTLLKEFHDHQMLTSRKDALGTELLSLPFSKEDLESILEDLTT